MSNTENSKWDLTRRSVGAGLVYIGSTLGQTQAAGANEINSQPYQAVIRYSPNIEALRNMADPQGAIVVAGYSHAGDQGGGLFIWVPEEQSADDGGIVVKSTVDADGRWVRSFSGAVDIRWFGAVSGGTEDAAKAIRKTLAFVTKQPVMPDIYIPPGIFLIAETIKIDVPFRRIFGEGLLVSGIKSAPPITSYIEPDKSPPSDSGFGHLDGACFYFSTLLYNAVIEGLSFRNFRFAMVWYTAHNSPCIKDCNFIACNVGALFYQGCQTTKFVDCAVADTNVLVIGAATCFDSQHPLRGRDNFYCDGLTVVNSSKNRRHYVPVNEAFDGWFRESILRPDVPSFSIHDIPGGYLYPFDANSTVCLATGRLIYLPFRNPRLCFNLALKDLDLGQLWRGLACINTTCTQGLIFNIDAEGLWAKAPPEFAEEALLLTGYEPLDIAGNVMINCQVGLDFPERRLVRMEAKERRDPQNWLFVNCWTHSQFKLTKFDSSTVLNADGLLHLS
jgi:hypothetical protein